MRRAVRVADGFMPLRPLEGGWERTLELLNGWLEEEGRDLSTFGLEPSINVSRETPEDWRQAAEQWRRWGATHLMLNTMGGGLEGPEAHIRALEGAWTALH